MKNYNWGIIAPGKIAEHFTTALQGVDRATLHSVASRKRERAEKFASEYGFSNVADDYDALIANPDVDVIYIASPHSFHAEQSVACLSAGKAVLCEKPMTVNLADAKRVIAAARDNKVFYMEAVWTRFLPIYKQVRAWLDDGKIGEVTSITANFGFNFPFDQSSRLYNPELAGGALLDMGIYPITLAQWVMGTIPTELQATGVLGSTGVDENTAVTLRYPSGAVASLTTTTRANTVYDAWIIGSEGRIKIPMFWCAESATLFDASDRKLVNGQTVELPHAINGYEGEINEVHQCLDQGLLESPSLSWFESLAVMKIMDGVREQIKLKYPFE